MKRAFSSLALLALLAAACGTAAGDNTPPRGVAFAADPVTLTVWAWDGVFLPSLIDAFELENPDIRIDLRTSGFDQHHIGILNAIEDDGTLPDVAAIERAWLPEFHDHASSFVDLGEFGAAELADDYLHWRWNEGVFDDRIVGLPTDVGGLALAYRADLFANAGLPSEPAEVAERLRTWDDFLELGVEFTAAGTDATFLDSVDSLYRAQLGQETHAYVDDDGQPILDESVANVWDFTITAVDEGLIAGLPQFSPEWNAGFGENTFAALAAPSWMRGHIAGIAPETADLWSIVPVPNVGGNWGGSQLAAPAAGQHEEQAWRFVEFMTSVATQLEILRESGNFPSTPALYNEPEIINVEDPFFGGENVGRIYVDSVSALPSQPTVPGQSELDRLFVDQLATYEPGDDADKLWEDTVREAFEILEGADDRDS